MSDYTDIEREIAEEDEIRRLLRAGDRNLKAPPFVLIEQRAARPRVGSVFGSVLMLLAAAIAIGVGLARVAVPASSAPSASPTPAVTATPQVANSQVRISALCPEAPKPTYLPWPSSRTQTSSEPTRTETTWFGSGSPAPGAARITVQPYADAQPETSRQIAGEREVFVYFTSGQSVEARAWWREPRGVCPVVTVALVWPEKDRAVQQSELLRVVASIPSFVASPAATSRPPLTYGVVVRESTAAVQVMNELGSVVVTLDDPTGLVAGSADGRRIAYWGGANAAELWVADLRDPQHHQKVLTLSDERGAGVVWSPTGKTLMFAAKPLSVGPGRPAAYTALRVVGLDGSSASELARVATDRDIRPLTWDERRDLAAAEEDVASNLPGRYILASAHPLVQESNGTTSNYRIIDLPDAQSPGVVVAPLEASSDGRFVMATWYYPDRQVVRFWPVEGLDFGRTRELSAEHGGDRVQGARWRPMTLEIGVNVAGQLELWTLDGQRLSTDLRLGDLFFAFRHDGTAVYSMNAAGVPRDLTEISPRASTTRSLPALAGALLLSVNLAPDP
jgi:hypothetical protein